MDGECSVHGEGILQCERPRVSATAWRTPPWPYRRAWSRYPATPCAAAWWGVGRVSGVQPSAVGVRVRLRRANLVLCLTVPTQEPIPSAHTPAALAHRPGAAGGHRRAAGLASPGPSRLRGSPRRNLPRTRTARARVRPTDTRVTETRYDNNALFRDADRLREPSHVSNRTRGACDTPIRHRPNKSSRASI